MQDGEDKSPKTKMSCGHVISTESMTQQVRSLIESRLTEIRCPGFKDIKNNTKCNTEWHWNIVKLVGVFTKEEMIEFETGLTKN